jgi:aromatic ring-opening dioxygenase LigB subunit
MSIIAGFMVPHPPMIVPAVGRGSEAQVAETTAAYERVADEIAALAPETIIITSPHSVMYADYFHISPGKSAVGSFASFRAPQVRFSEKYDFELTSALEDICRRSAFPAGTDGEREPALDHGVMVPLYFIEKEYTDFNIVRIGLSGLSLDMHRQLGVYIRDAVESLGRRVVFIASGDLAHCQKEDGPYGYAPEGPRYDEDLMKVMAEGDLYRLFDFEPELLDAAMECGHRSFCIMAGALDGLSYTTEVLSHEATFGVGYGIVRLPVQSSVG